MSGPYPTSAHQETNDIAGPYRLEAEIARGGFGVVYRAVHAESGERFAVKVLHADAFENPISALRFEREAAVLLALRHPAVVRMCGVGQRSDGRPFIAMELLHGESLDARLRRGVRFPPSAILPILLPLAKALDACHSQGVLHRDIKPSNIFLAPGRPEGEVVLLDFGVAKLVLSEGPALTTSRGTVGTIPFMSPEQIRGETLDARADVYSLAALAYTMLTGRPPFGAKVTSVLQQVHLYARPRPPSEVSGVDPALDGAILRALARDPKDRPKTATEFVETLTVLNYLNAAPPTAAEAPEGTLARPTLAVCAEARAASADNDSDNEAALDALEASLPKVWAELSKSGLVVLHETAASMLLVSVDPPDPEFTERVIAGCVRAYRNVKEGRGGNLVELGLVIHAGVLHTHESGAILQSGLRDVRTWAPRGIQGVLVSVAAQPESALRLEKVAEAEGYFRANL